MGKNKSKKGGSKKSYKKPSTKRLQQHPSTNKIGEKFSAPVENPFELRVNKRKHDNLGRRARNEQGVPGISRGRAIEKRKATLLKEYKVRNKSNMFLDKRIGEKRKGMPEEEKINKRSVAEKARQFKKKSIFNLHDSEETLTHKGQPLEDIDRYEDPRDASDSEDERLDADFVSDANFGGFMKMKVSDPREEVELDNFGQPKTHKQIIQELILASKQKKFEKAKEADENYELVCKLDDEFKNPEIRNLLLMGGKDPKNPSEEKPKETNAKNERVEYDMLVRELQFEAKTGNASNRLKTEFEVSNEEKDKLEQLERNRIRRMQMIDPENGIKHRSADDLDDGYFIEESARSNAKTDEQSSEEDSENGEKDSDDDDSDRFSDVVSDLDDAESDDSINTQPVNNKKVQEDDSKPEGGEVNEHLEIPYVLGIPVKYRDFESLLRKFGAHYKQFKKSKNGPEILDVILSRVIKYNKAADRSRLAILFNYMMRYVLESAEEIKRMSKTVKLVSQTIFPHLHACLVLNPMECMEAVEKGELFDDFYPLRKLPLFKLLYFDICSSLFCCTDFNHHVLSPVKVSLLQIISNHKASDLQNLMKIFYAVKIIHTLSNESKRYSPEVINFLSLVFHCFTEARSVELQTSNIRQARELLCIQQDENCKESSTNEKVWDILSDTLIKTESSVSLKMSILNLTLNLSKQFIQVYEKLPSSKEIFTPIKKVLLSLKSRPDWPKVIKCSIKETLTSIESMKQKKELLCIPISDKPKPLRLYEPLVEEDFDGIRKKKAPKGKQETARLSHKVKQEMKNAVREIRKDTAFIANQQLQEQLDKDAERKRKVKDILGSLAVQEGEYKKSKKGKK